MLQAKNKAIKALNQIQNHGQKFDLYPRQLGSLTQNEQTLIQGVKNYNQVMEVNADNFSKIGFIITSLIVILSIVMNLLLQICKKEHQFLLATNLNQLCTKVSNFKVDPYVMKTGYHWVVQLDRKNTFKNNCMGWNFQEDGFSKVTLSYDNLDEAVEYCKNMGFSYSIDQPRFRYIQKKNYGDRMKWKGFPNDNDPDQ